MIYRFDRFELDTERETLTDPGGTVALRGHALLVLKYLVERAPEVVTRDEILEAVWGHQELSESSIAQVIRDVRSALGDSARSPKHIATRYGRGYQFVGDVEAVDPADESENTTHRNAGVTPAAAPKSRWSRTLLVVAVSLLAIAGWQWYRGASSVPIADARESIALRAVAASNGQSLSAPLVDYLAFVLGNALGSDRVAIARDDAEIDPAARIVEVSLASLESGDNRLLELAIGRPALDDPELRVRFDEANELVRRGLEQIMAELESDADLETRLDAGLLSQSSFAVETLLRGMAAQFAGDVQRAAELFEAALAEDPDFEFARYELAIAVRRNGDHERALTILQPMADRLAGDFWAHRISNAMGIALWRLRRYDEALDALRRAESAADSPAGRAVVLTNIGLLERNQGRLDQAEATLREAVRLAELAELDRVEAGARNSLASVLSRRGLSDQALVQLELARELFYRTGNLRGYGAVLSRSARIHAARGERSESESLFRLALGIREQIGDEVGIADIQFRLARIHRVRGEFETARQLARSALERAQALDNDGLLIDCYQALAALALADQRFEQAEIYGNEALRLAELTGRQGDRRAIRLGLLESRMESGTPPPDLVAQLNDLAAEADTAEDRTVGVRARLLNSRVHRQNQRLDDARRAIDRAGQLLDDDLRLAWEVDVERARLALDRGRPDAAAIALDSLDRSNAPDYPRLMLRARVQAEQGDLKSAIETAGLARSSTGQWWRAEDQALFESWSAEIGD